MNFRQCDGALVDAAGIAKKRLGSERVFAFTFADRSLRICAEARAMPGTLS
jgi:hypothetical protein